jgi:hypothetical protein
MNVCPFTWGTETSYQIQGWSKNYIVRAAAPWPKGLNKNGNQLVTVNENIFW